MNDRVAQRALDRALDDREQLLLLYQPIHDAETREIYGAEALLRQRRESGEIREAGIITEAAERAPLDELYSLSSYLVKTAYEDAAYWQKSKWPDVRLNVNLSPREFEEEDLIGRLRSTVGACGVDTSGISLEITETSYIKKPLETVAMLREVRELGFQLWLDDFGTGHSSLTHLQHFPIDGIKLPEGFISGIVNDPRSRQIVKALIGLAHDFGMKVIAEAIEHDEQLSILRDFGCDYIQGFLFSRPMERDDFVDLLAKQ
jgi:EAL domain-containing protein (putative c-di-GMP-specific phosphodiesterase class I)